MANLKYDPELAEVINKQINSQAHVGVCCAIVYELLLGMTNHYAKGVVEAIPKELAKATAFSPTQCTVALNTLRQLGLITNLTKNSCEVVGEEGKYQLYRKGMK